MYKAPKLFSLYDINETNCAAAKPTKETFHASTVKSKQQYHHNMCVPGEVEEKFNIEFPTLISSSINEMTGDDGVSKSYHFFADIYGNYYQHQQTVNNQIDRILSELPANTTPEQLKAHFFASMKKLKKPDQEVQLAYSEEMPVSTKPLTPELFRHIALKILIQDELLKDKVGTDIKNSLIRLFDAYCKSLDTMPDLKEKIYSGIGIPLEMVDQPCRLKMNDIIHYQKHDATNLALAKKIDYTKSPQIALKIMESVPKEDKKKAGQIVLSETGQVLWTTIYDFASFPRRMTPINTLDEFHTMVYHKGDSANGIKPAFKMMIDVTVTTPSVFWGEVPKSGAIQFKATKLEVNKYIILGGAAKTMSEEEYARKAKKFREASLYYNIDGIATGGGGEDYNDNETDEDNAKRKRDSLGDDDNDQESNKRAKFSK
jgi:hypothetical protein